MSKTIDIDNYVPVVTFTCSSCGNDASAGYAQISPELKKMMVIHAIPICRYFEGVVPADFMRDSRIKMEGN